MLLLCAEQLYIYNQFFSKQLCYRGKITMLLTANQLQLVVLVEKVEKSSHRSFMDKIGYNGTLLTKILSI